jgi:hypothetical protein
MPTNARLHQGTAAWFEMVGTLMCEAASQSGLSPDLNVSLIERYTDGVELSEGVVQGLRFDIVGGRPSFKVGAQHGEQADITIDITAAAARALNNLYSADPNYSAALETFQSIDEMRVDGDLAQMGWWLRTVHDAIVDRTA